MYVCVVRVGVEVGVVAAEQAVFTEAATCTVACKTAAYPWPARTPEPSCSQLRVTCINSVCNSLKVMDGYWSRVIVFACLVRLGVQCVHSLHDSCKVQ
jgi:hypothetical protein